MDLIDSRREWIRSVVETYQGRLIRFAASLTGSGDAARDAVQETFLRLCRERFQPERDHLVAWLYRVCRHRALDARRKEVRMVSLDAALERSPGLEPAAASSTASRMEDGLLRRVLAALQELPDSQQEVLRLRFQEELSYKEISAVTGRSVSHVGVLIHDGMKRLRCELGHEAAASGKGGVSHVRANG